MIRVRGRLFQLAVAFQFAALACVAIAYAKRNDFAIEGAYFNRSVGAPAYAGLSWQAPVAPWLLAAGCLLVAAGVAFSLDRQRRP